MTSTGCEGIADSPERATEPGDSCLSALDLTKRLQQSCYLPWNQATEQVLDTNPTGQVQIPSGPSSQDGPTRMGDTDL